MLHATLSFDENKREGENMRAVILAGGLGTRLSEETTVRPKPMVEIGGKPILWHILKIYTQYGINDFVICCGYKGHIIKEYFNNYSLFLSDVTFDIKHQKMEILQNGAEPWRVTLVDTGEHTMTGGRLKRVQKYLGNETFCLTYGDGVCDVNITNLINFHRAENAKVTLTAVQPPGRFGAFRLPDGENIITSFREKPVGDGAWINGGFFVLEPDVFDYIQDDTTVWELDPLNKMSNEGKLVGYRHGGFWHPMDTLRDKMELENLWKSGKAPWKVWEN